jgi:acetyltransferase-like isoleucine patch superfamily enzyme
MSAISFKGVTIDENPSVVAAAVVAKDVPRHVVVAENAALIMKQLDFAGDDSNTLKP